MENFNFDTLSTSLYSRENKHLSENSKKVEVENQSPCLVNGLPNTTCDSLDEREQWLDILGTGQLKKKVLKPSESKTRPEIGDICTLSYTGYLDNGKIVEDEKEFKIHLGELEVIHGIDLAVALMEEGEEAELVIEPRFAFGKLGLEPKIPPNSRITYKIVLIAAEREVPVTELGIEKRLEIGKKKKERGNWWYGRNEQGFAIMCYRRALEYFDESDVPLSVSFSDSDGLQNESKLRLLLEERLKTCNNLAQAQIKTGAFDGALISIGQVLACQPHNVKAIFRKAKIMKEQGNIKESISEIRKALSIEPESQYLNQELSFLLSILRKNNVKEMNLFKKMMGNDSPDDRPPPEKHDSETTPSSIGTWRWIAFVSFAAAIIGAFAIKYKF